MKEINITLKPVIDFSNAKVGDDVFCTVFGIGKIIQINNEDHYSVKVNLVCGEEEYTKKGHLYRSDCRHASLYFYDTETQEVLYSRPEPEINWAEYEGKVIEVRDTDDDPWDQRTLWKYAPEFRYPFVCYIVGDFEGIYSWRQARLIE